MIVLAFAAHGEDFPSQVKKPVDRAITLRQQVQAADDQWQEKKTALMAEYAALEKETSQLSATADKLRHAISKTTAKTAHLRKQLEAVSRISLELTPFLQSTAGRLEAVMKEDLPFLFSERSQRLDNLKKTLHDPAIPVDKKFSRTVEALLIEAQYGHTTEVYQERIRVNDEMMLADIFRLGRVSLFFQSPDRKTSGVYNPLAQEWQTLPRQYSPDIRAAMETAMKHRTTDLLTLPLGRLELP